MATEQIPSTATAPVAPAPVQPLQAWLARLGLSGKLLGIGALVGVVAVFLPLMSVSMQMPNFGGKAAVNIPGVSTSHSWMVLSDGRGILCLLGYFAALALTYLLYQPNGLTLKPLAWAGLGVGGVLALVALWLLLAALGSSSGGMAGFGIQSSVGMGAILNLLAAGTVAAGGFFKAREEKLF